jgi:CHAT domain-containing protein/tetratricopeptide (TPR) repeat protein
VKRAALAAILAVCCACRPGPPPAQPADLLAAGVDQLHHGDLSQALDSAVRGIDLTRGDPASAVAWRLRLLRAEILLLQRRPADAVPPLRERLPDTPEFAPIRARQAVLQGQLQIVNGDLPGALTTLDQAARMASEARDPLVQFDARNLQGQAALRLGQWATGDEILESVVTDAIHAGSDYHVALASINRGMARLQRDRFDEALPYFERATALERVTMRIRGIALTNAGLCYTRLGDFDRAIAMQQRAVDAHKGSAPVFLEQALGELGTTYYLGGRVPEAIAHLTRALDVATGVEGGRAVDAKLDEDAAVWAVNLADIHVRLGAWDKAAEFNARARAINERRASPEEQGASGARLVYTTLNDARIAAGRGDRDRAGSLFRAVLANPGSDPFNASAAHAGLAQLALDAGRPAQAWPRYEQALRVVEQAQTALVQTDYKLPYLARLVDLYGRYVDALVAAGLPERALEIADSSRARVLAERHGVNPGARGRAAAFKALAGRSGSTLLFYWVGRPHSYAWAVTPREIRSATLPGVDELEPLVRAHQQAVVTSLANPVQSRASAGDTLYALLVAPFEDLRPASNRFVVVPDGPLSRVNFETLPVDGRTRHYWIEDAEISVAPSLGTLAAAPRTPAAQPRSLLLIGDPEVTDPAFPRLQYADMELTAVSGAFPAASRAVYRGSEASPAAFLDSDPGRFDVIHFTAHASANVESPLDSAVILAPAGGSYKLYARDVAARKLDADLVTISACRSAGDRTFSGEGLVGFAWAFLRAGARRVLAGLWDVDDRSTAAIMTAVYAGLARGERPAAAVRAAKLAMLARGGATAKPYYWGPFQLIVSAPY